MSRENITNNFNDILDSNKERETFSQLAELFGDKFGIEKTIRLDQDVDENNEQKEIKDKEAFWTEFIDPETRETVEGKIYFPKDGKIEKILIIEPGYRGDFVLQESMYADDFVKDGRAMLVLRHNGLRIEDDDVVNYLHCPDKRKASSGGKQKYLGKKDFDFSESNKEVLIALKSLEHSLGQIKSIDIIGHSWGGNIALRSIVELQKQALQNGDSAVISEKVIKKLNNLVLIGAWLETEVNVFHEEFFKKEEAGGYFKNLSAEKTIRQIAEAGQELKKIKAEDIPKNLRVESIVSIGEEEVDILKDIFGFLKRLKGFRKKGQIVLKELKAMMPEKIGGRETETHDYELKMVRNWIKMIIDKDKMSVSELLNNKEI
jgi:hypothetical protein